MPLREGSSKPFMIACESAVAYREHGGQPYHHTVMSYDERGRPEALLRHTENLGFEAIHDEYNSMNKLICVTVADSLRRHTTSVISSTQAPGKNVDRQNAGNSAHATCRRRGRDSVVV